MIELISETFQKIIDPQTLFIALRVFIVLVIGFVVVKIINFSVGKATKKRFSQQTAMLVRKGIFYTGHLLFS